MVLIGYRDPSLLFVHGQLESRFCAFEYKVSAMPFFRAASRMIQGFFSPYHSTLYPLFVRFVFLLFRVHNALNHARYNGV